MSSPKQSLELIVRTAAKQQQIAVECAQVSAAVSLCTQTPQAAPMIAELAIACAAAFDAWQHIDAAAAAFEAMLDAVELSNHIVDDPAQTAMRTVLAQIAHAPADVPERRSDPASCCIICHRRGSELFARNIGWARNGLCMSCARTQPIVPPGMYGEPPE